MDKIIFGKDLSGITHEYLQDLESRCLACTASDAASGEDTIILFNTYLDLVAEIRFGHTAPEDHGDDRLCSARSVLAFSSAMHGFLLKKSSSAESAIKAAA